MEEYKREEKLKLTDKVFITKEIKNILRKQKSKQGISMAKIVCNAIIKLYARDDKM